MNNTRCLVSRRPSSCLTLFHQNALTGAETRRASRLTITIPASHRHLGSVRAIQWCTGWPWRGRRRIAREENRLDEMTRNVQDFYINISRMHKLNTGNYHHHHHHNRRHRWSRHDHLSENRGRWRAGRERDEWENKPSSGQRDGFDDIIKRIEADPYEFLFGRSNAYLRLPKAWSPFCRSFLDISSTRDAKPKTSATEKASERKVTDSGKHSNKVSSDSSVINPVTSATHSHDLRFDPISGRMVPLTQPVEKQKEKEVLDIPAEHFSVSAETPSPEKHDLQSDKMKDAALQSMSKKEILYPEDTSNSTQKSEEGVISPDSVVTTQKPEVSREMSNPITNPKMRQFSDFDDENINQLSASDIRASFTSIKESPNNFVEATRNTSNEQVNEAAKHVKGFSGSMQLLNQELTDLCERLESSSAAVEPDLYRVLAYDPSTSKVVIAETTSSVHAAGKALPPSEVMLSINNPAKFLPYFARMKTDGYEIVSGGGNILVFKKGPVDGGLDFVSVQSAPSRISNMPVGSQAEAASLANAEGNSQPINHVKSTKPTSPGSSATPRMVRRQETVYTGGPPNWSPYPPPSPSYNLDEEITNTATNAESQKSSSSVGKAIRRVFLTGFATAGVFYAVGVVCEYFRTGGQDGLGPVGFTAFEAERRRRE